MRLAIVAVLALLLAAIVLEGGQTNVILATTTSTQDSGLLDDLVPIFEKQTGIKVKVIAVGTGEALAMGRRGDADVLLVHARSAEDAFMAAGFGSLRRDVMHNDFVLVGPAADPAKVRGFPIQTALKQIAGASALFATRGDGSGTHSRELALWRQAGFDPPNGAWYLSTGQGMGETARIASEKAAYLLIDRGTFLALRSVLSLAVVCEGGPDLRNPYGVIVVNPERFPGVHAEEARALADWLVSPATQRLIGQFGKARFGEPLFVPDAR
jgi:tungstate transport system substrate-binding protein